MGGQGAGTVSEQGVTANEPLRIRETDGDLVAMLALVAAIPEEDPRKALRDHYAHRVARAWLDRHPCLGCHHELAWRAQCNATLVITREQRLPRPTCCGSRCERAAAKAQRVAAHAARREKQCSPCGGTFTGTRTDAVYCSPACRQRAYRQRRAS
jgi:hypothetical protein